MAEPQPTLAGALQAARQGVTQAQEQARQAGGRRALLGAGDGGTERQSQVPVRADLLGDMVQLSRSEAAVKANAASIHIVSGVSEEVVNLGRRIDVKA
jgi:hypothetical protein